MLHARTILAAAIILAIAAAPAAVRADPASHEAAVKRLFDTMQMKELSDSSITQMIDMQVKQNPMMAPYKQIILDFTRKYMDWDVLAPEMIKLYMEQFTEEEINELVKFYATPIGQKTIKAMPELLSKGAAIGQRRMQEHMGELQQQIRDAAAKQAGQAPGQTPVQTPGQ